MGRQHLGPRRQRRVLDPVQEAARGTAAEVPERLADRCQRRLDDAAGIHVVEPRHGHVRRDADTGPLQLAQRADGHLIVRAHHGLRQGTPAEQDPGGRDAAVLGEVTVDDLVDAAAGSGRDGLLERRVPLGGVRRVLRAGDEAQPAVAVLAGEVPGQGRHAADVVAEEDVRLGLVAAAGDEDDGYLTGQGAQFPLIQDFLGDEQAVGLAREGAHPLLELLAPAAECQQEGVLGPAQHRLGRVHDVVDEQQAAALDVDLVRAPVQAHQADDVLPPPGKAARRSVRNEPQRLDDGQHPLARIGVHQAGSAQDAGHGGRRDPGHAGDVVDGRHGR